MLSFFKHYDRSVTYCCYLYYHYCDHYMDSSLPWFLASVLFPLSLFSLLATLQYSRIKTFSHLIPSRCLHALAQQRSNAREALLFPSLPPDGWAWGGKSERLQYFVRFRDSVIEILRDWHLVYFCNPLLFVCRKQRKGAKKQLPNLSWWIVSCSGLVIFVLHWMVKCCATCTF